MVLGKEQRVIVPIIKVVGDFCNLRCSYCFYHGQDQSSLHVMDDKLLGNFLNQYMTLFTGKLTFIWHGGEPLLAGLPFFEKIVLLQNQFHREHQKIRNLIQTNGTLINKDWALFFKAHNFRVGISLDGNRKSHNRFRMNETGAGSFDQVIRGIGILREYGLEPGFIQTVTSDNIDNVEEDFNFFANDLKIKKWGINVYCNSDGDNKAMLNQDVSNTEFTWYLKEYIKLWLDKDSEKLLIREIDNFFTGALKKKPSSCSFNGSCVYHFCLDYDGKIYPCDRSSNHPDLLLGDLSKQTLLEVLTGSKRVEYINNVTQLPSNCLDCKWKAVCNNGCSMLRVGGITGKDYYCETRKAIFEYVEKLIQKYINLAERQGGEKHERIECH